MSFLWQSESGCILCTYILPNIAYKCRQKLNDKYNHPWLVGCMHRVKPAPIHTAPRRLNCRVASRRRCVVGLTLSFNFNRHNRQHHRRRRRHREMLAVEFSVTEIVDGVTSASSEPDFWSFTGTFLAEIIQCKFNHRVYRYRDRELSIARRPSVIVRWLVINETCRICDLSPMYKR